MIKRVLFPIIMGVGGCLLIAVTFLHSPDLKAAQNISLYKSFCEEMNSAEDCDIVGRLSGDDIRAVYYFSKACDGGFLPGCVNLGVRYENGKGVDQNYEKAADLFKQTCGGGIAAGCNNLGAMYVKGLGVELSDEKAVGYYTRACDGGYLLGCSNLGAMYTDGRGVEQDGEAAVELLKIACDGGFSDACNVLDEAE